MNIILIGFMGTGKSSIGKLLAKKKNKQFVDIDEEIEKSENLSITEIFNNYGEDYFRDLESKYLQRIIEQKKDCVIACGGGVVLKEKNINLLKKNSVVILLSAEPEVIYNRVKNFAHRPLFQASDPVKNIKSLLFKRQPFYQKAKDFEIDTTNLSPEKIVEAIEAKLLSLKF